jgi:hypothetical protein
MPKVHELRPGNTLADGRVVRDKSLASASGRVVVRFEDGSEEWFDHTAEVELKNSWQYAWIITKDHLADIPPDRAGTTGPRAAPQSLLEQLKAGEGWRFRMKDDDGEIVYEGRYLSVPDDWGFGPLDDFGTPDAGCTSIEFFQTGTNGGWKPL